MTNPPMNPPAAIFPYQKPQDVNLNDIDQDLRGVFELLRNSDVAHPVCSCQGHPESQELVVWGTDIHIDFAYHVDDSDNVLKFLEEIENGYLDEYDINDDYYTLVTGTNRRNRLQYNFTEYTEEWIRVEMVYDYDTVGGRRAMIEIIEKGIKDYL